MIPPAAVLKGELEGTPFTPTSVTVEQDGEGVPRSIVLCQDAGDDGESTADCPGVRVTLPQGIDSGYTFAKTLDDKRDDCNATYYLPVDAPSGDSQAPPPLANEPPREGVVADWACAIRIDECGGATFDPEGDETQLTGSLSGAIAVCFLRTDPTTGEEVRSWVAGRFTDGHIRCTRPLPETEKPSVESGAESAAMESTASESD